MSFHNLHIFTSYYMHKYTLLKLLNNEIENKELIVLSIFVLNKKVVISNKLITTFI